MATTIADEFITQSVHRMSENLPRILKCLRQLSDEEVWARPNANSNSTGNLVLHLCGNITQYIISSIGGKPDIRKRDEEFSARGGFTRDQLSDMITTTVTEAINVITHMSHSELLKERSVQGFSLTGTGVILHVVEHLSYHTGQIAFWTKQLKDSDLGFYKGIDLNKKNSTGIF